MCLKGPNFTDLKFAQPGTMKLRAVFRFLARPFHVENEVTCTLRFKIEVRMVPFSLFEGSRPDSDTASSGR
jgi:hypothetical protein